MTESYKKTVHLGKVDGTGNGRRNNPVEIEITIENGRLSMVGNVWKANQSDIVSGGQNYGEILEYFPDDPKVKRIVEIWKRWHLNDMRAGSPAQMEYLRTHPPVVGKYPDNHYDAALRELDTAGLNPDPADGYVYGSAWLREELPAEIIEEVKGW